MDGNHEAHNILDTRDELKSGWSNYWLAGSEYKERRGFTLGLGCTRRVTGFKIKNSRDESASSKRKGTEKFKLSGAMTESGPWTEIIEHEMDDPKHNSNIQEEVVRFAETQVKFLKLKTEGCHNWGCALRYFKVLTGKSWIFLYKVFACVLNANNFSPADNNEDSKWTGIMDHPETNMKQYFTDASCANGCAAVS